MSRLIPSTCAVLTLFLCVTAPSMQAAEVARYDDGPWLGMLGSKWSVSPYTRISLRK